MLHRSIKKERENCCDDIVLNYQYNPFEYANALLLLEEQRQKEVTLALAATNNKKLLFQRIKRLIEAKTSEQQTPAQKWGLYIVFVVFVFVIGCTMIAGFQNKTTAKNATAKKIFQSILVSNYDIEKIKKLTISPNPIQPVREIKRKFQRKPVQISQVIPDYTITLVNEELLHPSIPKENIAVCIADKEEGDAAKELWVKVEEEESGKSEKKTYYYQLSDYNGKQEIKPLVMTNRYKKSARNKNTKKLKGIYALPAKKGFTS
jgi:hypothetical protein